MVSREILNSHPISTLKKEISKTNVKGYSKMKKSEIVELMMKTPSRFSHIKMKEGKPKKTAPPKQDSSKLEKIYKDRKKKAEPKKEEPKKVLTKTKSGFTDGKVYKKAEPKKVMAKPKADKEPKGDTEPKRPAPKKVVKKVVKKKTEEEKRRDKMNKMTPEQLMNALPDVAKANVAKFLPNVYEEYKKLNDEIFEIFDLNKKRRDREELSNMSYELNTAIGLPVKFWIKNMTPKGIADKMTENGISADTLREKINAFRKKLNDKKPVKIADEEKLYPKTREILDKGIGKRSLISQRGRDGKTLFYIPVAITSKQIRYFVMGPYDDIDYEVKPIRTFDKIVKRLSTEEVEMDRNA